MEHYYQRAACAAIAALGLDSAWVVAYGADTDGAASTEASRPAATAVPEVHTDSIEVVAERFDKARNALSAKTGSSQFVFDLQEISQLPQGENTPLNQLMLRAPGVVQGDYGELHIRGEMTQPQYRINGTIIPEGISGFGQLFDTRFAERIEFITGALPAQYNYRTNVIDIETKQRFDNGGKVSLYGGSYGTINPAVELSGSKDKFTYYLTGSYLQAENGILLPTADREAIHDDTVQSKGFAYVSFLPNPGSRWSLLVGAAQSQFEIPNVPGQPPTFPLDGVSYFPNLPSTDLNENQRDLNRYAIISYEGTNGA
ncbi:MAG TPA: TonB-dependent receptor, partial [Burkholderiales bacterium]|nr:TonB-dependent receptor [Burkholderiales bacterium]